MFDQWRLGASHRFPFTIAGSRVDASCFALRIALWSKSGHVCVIIVIIIIIVAVIVIIVIAIAITIVIVVIVIVIVVVR